MADALFIVALLDNLAPNGTGYRAGTIITVEPIEAIAHLCGGDVGQFLAVRVSSSKYSYSEMKGWIRHSKIINPRDLIGAKEFADRIEQAEQCRKAVIASYYGLALQPTALTILPKLGSEHTINLDKITITDAPISQWPQEDRLIQNTVAPDAMEQINRTRNS